MQHMQKALPQMHVQLTQGLTDLTGMTGLALIRAMVAGERDPVQRARFRDPRCAHSTEASAQALTGPERAEHVFALQQALALYAIDTIQVRECDGELARPCHAIKPRWSDEPPPLDRAHTPASPSKNAPAYDARSLLHQWTGVD
jgi:transposase